MIGDLNRSVVSAYQPSQEVADFTKEVKDDYRTGVEIINRSWVELNNRSVIEDENRGQLMFNAFVDESVEDPRDAWRWRGTRSMARNKGIATHAQITASYLIPQFIAQNDDQEIDRDMSEIMNEVVEWLVQPSNSEYMSSFIQVVFGMETSPVTFMGAEYLEVYQKIKEKSAEGVMTIKEVVDEVLSGFKAPIWSCTQVLINNAFERNMQKQKCNIERRDVEYSELQAKYGDHPNWAFVTRGVRSIYNEEDGLFYDTKDDNHPSLLVEETYKNRREDVEVCFINGIYFGADKIDNNPIKHRDHRNTPKYNKVPFGFTRIGNHFFYYKSMMNHLGWDNMRYDALDEIIYNRALLEVDMPIAVTGIDKVDSEVIFPKSVVALTDPTSRAIPLLPTSNLMGGLNVLKSVEEAIDQDSINKTISGDLPDASQKAYTVAQARADAKKNMSAILKSLAESLVKYGDLMKDIILNKITVPQIENLVSGNMTLKYPTFFLENKPTGGKMNDKIIKFDSELIGKELTDEEKFNREMKLLEEIGYPKNKKSLTLVNPEIFAAYNYLCVCDINEMFNKTNEYMEQMMLALRAQFANDPTIDLLAINRELLYSIFKSKGDKFIKETPEPQPNQNTGQLPAEAINKLTNKPAPASISGNVVQ